MSKIEKNVPIPEIVDRNPLLNVLEVGDSFAFATERRNSIQSQASVIKRKTGKSFTVKKIDDEWCRIWRVA